MFQAGGRYRQRILSNFAISIGLHPAADAFDRLGGKEVLGQQLFSLIWSPHGYLLKGISRVSCIAIMCQQRDKAHEDLYEIVDL